MDSINKIVKKNLNKSPHLTCSISLDKEMEFLKLYPSNMSHALLQKMVNEDM